MKKKRQHALASIAVTAGIVGSVFTSGVPAHASPNVSCGPITAADGAAAVRLNHQLTGSLRGYLTAYRVSCARAIVNAVQGRRLSDRASVIAITTVIVESLLDNNPNVIDHTSVGLFQQQDSWGSTANRLNPTWATNAFINEMLRMYPGGSWQNEQIGVVAQAVQRSAFGERYQPQAADAQKIVNALAASDSVTAGQVGGASVYNPDTRTAEVFTLGRDGAMGHSYSTDGGVWSDWSMINGGSKFAGVPSVVHNPVTHALELFAVGKDRGLYHAYWVADGGWSSWSRLGDWTFSGSPVSVYNPDTRTAEVFALGEDGAMAHSYSTDGGVWSDSSMINGGSKFAGVPSVVHNPVTHALELFAVGK
ncbi:peptidase M23, partial [Streptomyces goshikiensis]